MIKDINSTKILSMIALGESETLEFKESFGDEAIEVIGSFSNARGGILLIGIKDSGEICGFRDRNFKHGGWVFPRESPAPMLEIPGFVALFCDESKDSTQI